MGDIGIDRRFFVITLCGVMAMLAGSAYWLLRQREDLTKEERTWQEAFGSGLLAGGNLAIMLGMLYQWDGRVILPAWILNAAAIWAVGFAWNKPAIRWYALWVAIGMVGTRAVYHGDQMATTYRLLINDRFSSLLLVTALYFTAGLVLSAAEAGRSHTGSPNTSEIGCCDAPAVGGRAIYRCDFGLAGKRRIDQRDLAGNSRLV